MASGEERDTDCSGPYRSSTGVLFVEEWKQIYILLWNQRHMIL